MLRKTQDSTQRPRGLLRCSTAVALAVMAALAGVADATSIELNPTMPVGDVTVLDHRSPVFGGRPAPEMVKPLVKEDPTLSRAEVANAVASNDSSLVNVSDASAGVVHGAARRSLEANSPDIARLEAHFGQSMITNLGTLQQQYARSEKKPSPWPSSYWPTFQDSINHQWEGGSASPAEKYARAFGQDVNQFMNRVSSTLGIDTMANSGRACTSTAQCAQYNDGSECSKRAGRSSGYCIPTWWGICHAWAPAATLEDEPACNVVKNGVTFKPFDIKALLTAVYDGAAIPVVFTGARYDGPGSGTDEYGRAKDAAERDLGPGFFHIAVTNIMGRFGKSFIVDVESGAAVWNQPVRGYDIKEANIMSPATAARTYFNVPAYPFNNNAVKVAYVHMVFRYINEMYEDGPLVSNGRVDAATVAMDYYYLLELDGGNNIIGGEWLYQSQRKHPDFLWFTPDKPDVSVVTNLNIKYKDILDLLQQSVSCSTNPPDSGDCGNDQTGPKPCPEGQYCQPWNPTQYQCRSIDAKCGKQETGVDFYGDDLATVQLLLPEECCDKCRNTPGCKAYTFINYNPDGKAYCYLKKGSGQRRSKVGAVSAVIAGSDSDKCNAPENGVDYYGDDLSSASASSAGECCDKCSALSGCKAYTFIPSASACYMKKGTGIKRSNGGAISGTVKGSTPGCSTPMWGSCGNAADGAACCPSGAYCQPWDTKFYQCIQTPSKCSQQLTGVDFYGEDIRMVSGIGPGECCDECARTSGCKAYTYINDALPKPACYLKRGSSDRRSHGSAVSGILN